MRSRVSEFEALQVEGLMVWTPSFAFDCAFLWGILYRRIIMNPSHSASMGSRVRLSTLPEPVLATHQALATVNCTHRLFLVDGSWLTER